MATFPLGKLYSTRGVAEMQKQDRGFVMHVWNALKRYKQRDWGDISDADIDANNEALENGGRILASYEDPGHPDWRVWIITEADRSATTVLFPDEY